MQQAQLRHLGSVRRDHPSDHIPAGNNNGNTSAAGKRLRNPISPSLGSMQEHGGIGESVPPQEVGEHLKRLHTANPDLDQLYAIPGLLSDPTKPAMSHSGIGETGIGAKISTKYAHPLTLIELVKAKEARFQQIKALGMSEGSELPAVSTAEAGSEYLEKCLQAAQEGFEGIQVERQQHVKNSGSLGGNNHVHIPLPAPAADPSNAISAELRNSLTTHHRLKAGGGRARRARNFLKKNSTNSASWRLLLVNMKGVALDEIRAVLDTHVKVRHALRYTYNELVMLSR